MATYEEILSRRWPGAHWTFTRSGDYNTLIWHDDTPKPTLAEIQALDAEVTVDLQVEARADRQEKAFLAASGKMVTAIEILTKAIYELHRNVQDMKTSIKATARNTQFTTWDAQVINAVQALKAELENIRSQEQG